MLTNKKVIIFDMDGTLIDSVGIWNDVDRELTEELGGDAETVDVQARRDEAMRKYHTAENPYLAYCGDLKEIYNSPLSADEIFQKRYNIAKNYLENNIDYKPDAEKMLYRLKDMGLTLAIASTTRRNNMETYRIVNKNIMSKAPIDKVFSIVYTKEDAVKTKPDPEIYLKVMAELGVAPAECLIFEDSLIGAEAAKAAGAEVVVMYDRYSDNDREKLNAIADHTFDNYAEVMAIISK